MPNRRKYQGCSTYAGVGLLSVLILLWVMQLWKADLRIPFVYFEDALFNGMLIKGMIDNGWYLYNNFIAIPHGLNISDFPTPDNFPFLIMKLISLVFPNWALTINLYFLATFPLATLTSFYVFRNFQLPYFPSIVAAVLFAFLPYHLLRGERHLILSGYYLIPLVVMVALWISMGNLPLITHDETKTGFRLAILEFKPFCSLVICILTASSGIYYAFFACYLLMIGGISAYFSKRRLHCFAISVILISTIGVVFMINILPTILFHFKNGGNPVVAHRAPVEAEFLGMKITQLFIPIDTHGIPFIVNLKRKYADQPLPNEGSEYLGLFGAIGFALLILQLLKRRIDSGDHAILLQKLSELNIFAVLLGTIGGVGSLFALLISPSIRAYNRISVYIAFLSLFAFVILLHKIEKEYITSRSRKFIFFGMLGVILFIGVLDQTPRYLVPHYQQIKLTYNQDHEFINRIEANVPRNSMIFQLPFVPFPENPPVHKMEDYDHFRGYLHSTTLRWSYGAMKGREGDRWLREISTKPPAEFVKTLAATGFSGIYLDRNGYPDAGKDLEIKLASILDTNPIVSSDNRLLFFNMAEFNKKSKEKL